MLNVIQIFQVVLMKYVEFSTGKQSTNSAVHYFQSELLATEMPVTQFRQVAVDDNMYVGITNIIQWSPSSEDSIRSDLSKYPAFCETVIYFIRTNHRILSWAAWKL